ncbi:MAG: hypothetical protein IRZ05_13115 [Micromonosporaceae bacterium]|nr:hypothetical protein [Micromonosporaceae bacterium]
MKGVRALSNPSPNPKSRLTAEMLPTVVLRLALDELDEARLGRRRLASEERRYRRILAELARRGVTPGKDSDDGIWRPPPAA